MVIERVPQVNRAFSAGAWGLANPGALPQARCECCAFGAKQKPRCSDFVSSRVPGGK
jgi:hypothetical protein